MLGDKGTELGDRLHVDGKWRSDCGRVGYGWLYYSLVCEMQDKYETGEKAKG